jgi:hypothetical protein
VQEEEKEEEEEHYGWLLISSFSHTTNPDSCRSRANSSCAS